MQLPVDAHVYETLERASPYLIGWVAFFTLVTIVRIVRHTPGAPLREGMIAAELPGLPLMLLHSAGFVLSLLHRDPVSTLLFLWWGPGYVFVAIMLLVRARRRSPPLDWKPVARLTSYLCKLSYVAFMVCYGAHGLWGIPFVFSAWIMQDQVKLTWLRGNADRTRRVSEDLWLPRVLYAGGLALPFVVPVPLRPLALVMGVVTFLLWIAGLARVVRAGRFHERPNPHSPDNLRDIVYLNERPY